MASRTPWSRLDLPDIVYPRPAHEGRPSDRFRPAFGGTPRVRKIAGSPVLSHAQLRPPRASIWAVSGDDFNAPATEVAEVPDRAGQSDAVALDVGENPFPGDHAGRHLVVGVLEYPYVVADPSADLGFEIVQLRPPPGVVTVDLVPADDARCRCHTLAVPSGHGRLAPRWPHRIRRRRAAPPYSSLPALAAQLRWRRQGGDAVGSSADNLIGDESGADTFGRFRYQAKVTLLYWLETALPGGPTAVLAEHVEDTAVEDGDSYKFMQIKSRSSDRLWTAGHMCADGGGIDSLARAYSIAETLDATFELHLEGGTSPSHETKTFVDDCTQASTALRKKVQAHLKSAGATQRRHVDSFLKRLRIVSRIPAQNTIDQVCLANVVRLAPTLGGQEIVDLTEKLLAIVEHAQEARHPALAPDAAAQDHVRAALRSVLGFEDDEEAFTLAEAKRLSGDRLCALLPVPPAEPMLLREQEVAPASALERKLTVAGALPTVIQSAKFIRAMADARRFEILAGPEGQIEQLEDVTNRVLTHAHAVAAGWTNVPDPANRIWKELVTAPGIEAADQFELFVKDRMALVGLLCCISDECRFGWAPS